MVKLLLVLAITIHELSKMTSIYTRSLSQLNSAYSVLPLIKRAFKLSLATISVAIVATVLICISALKLMAQAEVYFRQFFYSAEIIMSFYAVILAAAAFSLYLLFSTKRQWQPSSGYGDNVLPMKTQSQRAFEAIISGLLAGFNKGINKDKLTEYETDKENFERQQSLQQKSALNENRDQEESKARLLPGFY